MTRDKTTPSKSWVRDLFPQGSWDQRARHCFMGRQMQEHGEVGQGCLGLSRPIILWLDTSHLHAIHVGIFWYQTHTELLLMCADTWSSLKELENNVKSWFTQFYLNGLKYKDINTVHICRNAKLTKQFGLKDMMFAVSAYTGKPPKTRTAHFSIRHWNMIDFFLVLWQWESKKVLSFLR